MIVGNDAFDLAMIDFVCPQFAMHSKRHFQVMEFKSDLPKNGEIQHNISPQALFGKRLDT